MNSKQWMEFKRCYPMAAKEHLDHKRRIRELELKDRREIEEKRAKEKRD